MKSINNIKKIKFKNFKKMSKIYMFTLIQYLKFHSKLKEYL